MAPKIPKHVLERLAPRRPPRGVPRSVGLAGLGFWDQPAQTDFVSLPTADPTPAYQWTAPDFTQSIPSYNPYPNYVEVGPTYVPPPVPTYPNFVETTAQERYQWQPPDFTAPPPNWTAPDDKGSPSGWSWANVTRVIGDVIGLGAKAVTVVANADRKSGGSYRVQPGGGAPPAPPGMPPGATPGYGPNGEPGYYADGKFYPTSTTSGVVVAAGAGVVGLVLLTLALARR
jgi:hypothetical protein